MARFPEKSWDAMVAMIRKDVELTYTGPNIGQACLTWAMKTYEHLTIRGYRACIQAGSAYYQRVPGNPDEWPTDDTHFSYVWDGPPSATSLAALKQSGGHLPEMHVWVALPDTMELIDLTTCYVPANCKAMTGLDWLGPKPPDYIWTTPDKGFGDTVAMIPDVDATILALTLLGFNFDASSVRTRKASGSR